MVMVKRMYVYSRFFLFVFNQTNDDDEIANAARCTLYRAIFTPVQDSDIFQQRILHNPHYHTKPRHLCYELCIQAKSLNRSFNFKFKCLESRPFKSIPYEHILSGKLQFVIYETIRRIKCTITTGQRVIVFPCEVIQRSIRIITSNAWFSA